MIILDTNVLSALMRTSPDAEVVDWLDRQPAQSICITSITLFEAHFGIALLARGKRQRMLAASLHQLIAEDLENRVLDFDTTAATEAANLAATRQRAGHPVDMRNTQIAGIALARRASIATRNVSHFPDLKVPVVNPWEAD
jgi:predicted nucleic acid-binding protein